MASQEAAQGGLRAALHAHPSAVALFPVALLFGAIIFANQAASNLAAQSARPLFETGGHFDAKPSATEPGRIDLSSNGFLYYHLDPTVYQPQPSADDFNTATTVNLWWFELYGPDVIELRSATSDGFFSYAGEPGSQAAIILETQRRAETDRGRVRSGTADIAIALALVAIAVVALQLVYRSASVTVLIGSSVLSLAPVAALAAIGTITQRSVPPVAVSPELIVQLTDAIWAASVLAAVAAIIASRGPRSILRAQASISARRVTVIGAFILLPVSALLVAIANIDLAFVRAIMNID